MLLKMYWLYRLRCVSSATCHPNWVSPPSLHPSLCLSPCTRSTSLPESTALCLGILIELQSSTCYRQSPCFCILLLQIFQFTMNFLHESLIIYDNSGMKYTYQTIDHRPHMCHTTHHYLLSIRKRIISCFNLQCYSAMRLRCYMHSLAIRMWIVWVSGMSALIISNTLWSDCSPALKKINKHKTLLVQAQ